MMSEIPSIHAYLLHLCEVFIAYPKLKKTLFHGGNKGWSRLPVMHIPD